MLKKISNNCFIGSPKHLWIVLCLLFLFISVNGKNSEGKDLADINNLISVIEDKYADWSVQINAIKKIAESSDPRGLEALLRLINDPFLNHDCPALKFYAAEALGRYKGDSRVIETLINIASDNDNPLHVREVAIRSLGDIGDRRAIGLLINTLKTSSFALRRSSIEALGRIGDPSAIPHIEALLESEMDLKAEVHIVLNMLRVRR